MKLETDLCRFEISSGILEIYYKSGAVIKTDDANRIINTRLELCQGAVYPLLIVDEGIISIEINAWRLFASAKGTAKTSAGAFVLQSVYSKILANFFLKFIKPDVPVQSFNERTHALNWLEAYKCA